MNLYVPKLKGLSNNIKHLENRLLNTYFLIQELEEQILDLENKVRLEIEVTALDNIKIRNSIKHHFKQSNYFRCIECVKYFTKEDSYQKGSSYCKECHKKRRKTHYLENLDSTKERVKKYRKKNKKKMNLYACGFYKRKRQEDPLFKLAQTVRNYLGRTIRERGWKKSNRTLKYIGCSYEELKNHIENQFKVNMTWNNHGLHGWHIDHIIPISSAKNEEELYRLFHYTNLQPLWAKENLSKGAKLITPNNTIIGS